MFNLFKRKPRGPEIWRHDSFSAMSLAAAAFIRETAKFLIAKTGRFTLGLGGSALFREIFERIVHSPVHSALHWPSVHLFWCEELLLAPDDARSYYRRAREQLIDRAPLPNANVHRLLATPEDAPETWARSYEDELARFFAIPWPGKPPVFDCLLLAHARFDDVPGRWVAPHHEPAAVGEARVPVLGMTACVVNAAANVLFFAADPSAGRPEDSRLAPAGRCVWLLPRP